MGITFDPALIVALDDGFQELVRFILFISLSNGLHEVLRFLAFTLHEGIHSDFDPLPSFITIHSIVPPNDGNNFAGDLLLLDELVKVLEVSFSRLGRRIPTVPEEVDVDLLQTDFFRSFEERIKMRDMRVNSAVANETEEVQTAAILLGLLEGVEDGIDLVELALLDGLIDTDDILPDNTPSANVKMP
jgi:hypothetical protein